MRALRSLRFLRAHCVSLRSVIRHLRNLARERRMVVSRALFVLSVVLLIFGCSASDDPFQNVGYINVSKERGANMFYWFFEAMNGNVSAPVILWLQGGPGCSAMMGLFNENGPYKVTDDLELVPNNNTWNLYYHMLYIDNPVGTGFSYVEDPKGYVTSEAEMGIFLHYY